MIPDPESYTKAAERGLNVVERISRYLLELWKSQRYELLAINGMDLNGSSNYAGSWLIETQSRLAKRRTRWKIQLDGPRRWPQVQEFWQMPCGRRLYILQKAKISGRRRLLFGTICDGAQLRMWAEEQPAS